MDHATLLTKYIAYIADCEGIDDIEPIDLRDLSAVSFTDDEWQALQAIHAAQARHRYSNCGRGSIVDPGRSRERLRGARQ